MESQALAAVVDHWWIGAVGAAIAGIALVVRWLARQPRH
jgi:hypothetical protein